MNGRLKSSVRWHDHRDRPPTLTPATRYPTPSHPPAYEEKIYRAHFANGGMLDLFQQHWDVNLPPESLTGLTVEEAQRKRTEKMMAAAYGSH